MEVQQCDLRLAGHFMPKARQSAHIQDACFGAGVEQAQKLLDPPLPEQRGHTAGDLEIRVHTSPVDVVFAGKLLDFSFNRVAWRSCPHYPHRHWLVPDSLRTCAKKP